MHLNASFISSWTHRIIIAFVCGACRTRLCIPDDDVLRSYTTEIIYTNNVSFDYICEFYCFRCTNCTGGRGRCVTTTSKAEFKRKQLYYVRCKSYTCFVCTIALIYIWIRMTTYINNTVDLFLAHYLQINVVCLLDEQDKIRILAVGMQILSIFEYKATNVNLI